MSKLVQYYERQVKNAEERVKSAKDLNRRLGAQYDLDCYNQCLAYYERRETTTRRGRYAEGKDHRSAGS